MNMDKTCQQHIAKMVFRSVYADKLGDGDPHTHPTILSVELVNGQLEVVKRENNPLMGHSILPPVKILKDVYGISSYWEENLQYHELKLLKTIPAKYVPAQPESWEWEE